MKIFSLVVIAILAVSTVNCATAAVNNTDEPIVTSHNYLTVHGVSSGKTYYLYNAKNQLLDSAPAGYMIPTDCVRFLMPGNVSDWNHLSYFEINNGNVVKYGLANLTITNTTNYTYSTYKEIYPNIYTKVNATEFVYDYSADAHRIYDTFGV